MLSHFNVLVTLLFVTSIQSLGIASKGAATSIHGSDKTRERVQKIVGSLRKPWIGGFKSILHTSESSCADEVAVLIEAIESGHEWAFQMLDASSSFQSGLMKGNFKDVGMYDECVEVNEQYSHVSIRGKHCMVSLGSLSPPSSAVIGVDYLRLFSSICVPSSCNETDVEQIMNATIANTPAMSDLEFKVSEASCARVGNDDLSTGEIYTLIFFMAIATFMITCTICDCTRRQRPTQASTFMDTLAKFSLYTSALTVLSTEVKVDTLQSVQGIRVMCMCWIMLGHRFLTLFVRPVVNVFEVDDWMKSWESLYIETAPFAVDTFFVVSGFFTTYGLLKAMKSGGKINWPMFYIRRYLRLTPPLAVIVWLVSLFTHHLENGPLWRTSLTMGAEVCQKNWWFNFLYLQNFVMAKNFCLFHTWYLAADMQLFWISPIIIYTLHHWPKYGIRLLGFFLLASIVRPAAFLAINGYSNRVFTMRVDLGIHDLSDFFNFYTATYNRASPYFLGMFLGYDVATKRRQLTKVNVLINWIVTCVLLLFCACAAHFNYNYEFAYSRVFEVISALTLRPCWAISITWIIYACTHGYGGPVNSFLSWPYFGPLSRISFSVYLLHPLIQALRNAIARTPAAFSNSIIILELFIDLPLSIVGAFLFTLFFESPLVVLEKMFVNPKSKSNQVTLVRGSDDELQVENPGIRNKSTKED